MSLTLHVDADRWRAHLRSTTAATPGLVPVIKGNGYGFGRDRLAAEAQRLNVPTVAVGETGEVADVRAAYVGDVLVLAPLRQADDVAGGEDRVIRTVSHLDVLRDLAGSDVRVVVEVLTSMNRHGIPSRALDDVPALLAGVRCEGIALHLPLDRPKGSPDDVAEVSDLLARCGSAGVALPAVWVSHVTRDELSTLRARFPDIPFRARVGTALWLGDAAAFRATARVLDVRPLAAGERVGYRQRPVGRATTLLVLSAGTSSGVGLEAPKAVHGVLGRAKVLGSAGLLAAGRSLSPFTVAGRKRWYAEPPHMQVSLVLLPRDVAPPAIGDEIEVAVRMTVTAFDQVTGL